MVLDLQLNERAYLVSVVATIFVPLTFITGFFGMTLGGWSTASTHEVAFWLLGFVVPAATAALSWRLFVRRFLTGRYAELTPLAPRISSVRRDHQPPYPRSPRWR